MPTPPSLTSAPQAREYLETLAERLRSNLEEMSRPLVIEFAGSPKAGKTTCVGSLAKFLRRSDIPTHIVTERAAVCPIKDKQHPFFNYWTSLTSISKLLEAVELQPSVVILDRGLFDSLAWMEFHRSNGALDAQELHGIKSFFLQDRLVRQIDLVACLTVDVEEALRRERREQIFNMPGSIMNEDALQSYNSSIETVRSYAHSYFSKVVSVDTTDRTPEDGVLEIARNVMTALDDLLDERIGVVPRSLIERVFEGSTVIIGKDNPGSVMEKVLRELSWMRRSEAEERYDLVQLVPVCTVNRSDPNEVLVIANRGLRPILFI